MERKAIQLLTISLSHHKLALINGPACQELGPRATVSILWALLYIVPVETEGWMLMTLLAVMHAR